MDAKRYDMLPSMDGYHMGEIPGGDYVSAVDHMVLSDDLDQAREEEKRCRESEENAIKRMDEMGAELEKARADLALITKMHASVCQGLRRLYRAKAHGDIPDYCADWCEKKGPLKSGCESCPFYAEKAKPDPGADNG